MKFAQEYLDRLIEGIKKVPLERYEVVANVILEAYDHERQVLIFGNGGSAAIASHMACDLGKGTLSNVYDHEERRFRVISLTDNMATFSALANDVGYEHVFSQQLRNLVQPMDVVIGISGSGNSANVINAFLLARQLGAITIGFVGFDGGKMTHFCDYVLHFEEKNWQRCEDAHLIFQHLITSYIAEKKRERDIARRLLISGNGTLKNTVPAVIAFAPADAAQPL
jgi:D-sedoheptulose 7-phosphate isomerase